MRKRRVGVTARSRQNVGNQVTGTLQVDTVMAAPLELRTPAGTLRQRLQTECGWKHGDKGAGKSTGRETIKQNMQREREEEVRRRQSPLRPRPPFPRDGEYRTERIRQGFASRATTARP